MGEKLYTRENCVITVSWRNFFTGRSCIHTLEVSVSSSDELPKSDFYQFTMNLANIFYGLHVQMEFGCRP